VPSAEDTPSGAPVETQPSGHAARRSEHSQISNGLAWAPVSGPQNWRSMTRAGTPARSAGKAPPFRAGDLTYRNVPATTTASQRHLCCSPRGVTAKISAVGAAPHSYRPRKSPATLAGHVQSHQSARLAKSSGQFEYRGQSHSLSGARDESMSSRSRCDAQMILTAFHC
jgi:hypothetical protein